MAFFLHSQDAGGRWVKWASFIRKLLNTFLFFSQLLSNAVYALFIAQNIKPVSITSHILTDDLSIELSQKQIITCFASACSEFDSF